MAQNLGTFTPFFLNRDKLIKKHWRVRTDICHTKFRDGKGEKLPKEKRLPGDEREGNEKERELPLLFLL